ncbi:MAG: hypothetical protein R3B13_30265 [Polyangiaceae bacterium]
MAPLRRRVALDGPIDLALTLGVFVRGRKDPHMRREADGTWWRAMRSPDGPCTLAVRVADGVLECEAHGPGAAWALEIAPDLVGARDDSSGFAPTGFMRELHRRFPGMRIPRAHTVLQVLTLVIFEQKVVGKQAWQAHYGLAQLLGETAPGPVPLLLPAAPAKLAALPYYELHRVGVERRRAETLIRVAKHAAILDRLPTLALDDAKARLGALRGIGPWSVAEVARLSLGDADAVSVGDYHLPRLVNYNLTGDDGDADDARMLELLAPFAGHRGRVQRLLEIGGRKLPRRGPRLAPIPLHRR